MKMKTCLFSIVMLFMILCGGLTGASPVAILQDAYQGPGITKIPVYSDQNVIEQVKTFKDRQFVRTNAMSDWDNNPKFKNYYIKKDSRILNSHWSREASRTFCKEPGCKYGHSP